jgi:flavin reductase (DIM6/NTAB) family NADH-FMN oxidoreductase RutF
MIINFDEISKKERIGYMYQTIVPRPIAWISTESNGITNLAPFSFFSGVTSEPPIVMVSIGHKPNGVQKDTLRNIRVEKKCVINVVKPEMIEKMHNSAKPFEPNESELEALNVEHEKIFNEFPPMIKNTPVAMFCILYQEVAIEGSTTIPLFLKVEHFYIDETVVDENSKFELDLVARLGQEYGLVKERIKL